MPKIKPTGKKIQRVLLGGLRYVFLMFYLAVLGGAVYSSRAFFEARQEREALSRKEMMIRSVLPPFDNEPWQEKFFVAQAEIFPAKKISKSFSPSQSGESVLSEFQRPVGFSMEVPASGREALKLFIGIDLEGKITGVQVAGYGIAEAQNKFLQELKGMNLEWVSTELQAGIQNATIKQMAEVVKTGLDFYARNREEILKKLGVIIPPPVVETSVVPRPQGQDETSDLSSVSEPDPLSAGRESAGENP